MLSVPKTNTKIILFILITAFLSVNAAEALAGVRCRGTINSYQLNIRNIPSRFGDILAVLTSGQIVDVSVADENENWLQINYNGKKGYIRNRAKYIKLECEEPAESVDIQTDPGLDNPSEESDNVVKTANRETASETTGPAVSKAEPAAVNNNTEPNRHEAVIREKIKEKIKTQKKLAQSFSKKEQEIIEGLNEIDYTLNKARLKVRTIHLEINNLEDGINKLERDREDLSDKITFNRNYAGKRLKALYKMKMLGRLDAADMPTTVFDFFLQQNSMKRIIVSDYAFIEKQREGYKELELLEEKLELEMKAKTELEEEYKDQIRIKQQESYKRELILKDIRKKKRLSLAAIESLKQAAIKLDQEISTLKTSKELVFDHDSFAGLKGRLLKPVKGKIISRFGPSKSKDHKIFTFQKGIDIRVERGEPVKSVFKGKVMFAEWLMGYGNLLIINHGENYYTLYAHVEEMFKKKGETVETGEVIATAGDTGSIKGLCLHFEVRHHGKPINPMKWFKKGV